MRGEMDWPRIMGTVFAISLVHLLFSYAFKEKAPFGGWPVAGAQGIQGAINGIWVVGGIVMLIVVSWALMKRGEAREGAEKARTGSGWLSNRWRDLLRRAGLGRLREEWGKLYNRPGMEPEIMYRNRLLVMRVYDQALRYDIYIQKMRAFKKTVLDINTDRAQAGQKPYKAIEQEYVDYRSKQAQADWARMADKEMVVGWSFLTRESVNTLNAVYDGLGRNPTSSDIEAWTSALDALKARLEASFKEHETKRRYLENYHPLRAEIMRLPLFQLSPRDEIRFVRTYALEGSSRNVEAEMMQEWSQFMKDYQYGTQHPASRTVGEYIDAWKRGIFNDNALTGEPKGGGEGDPAFDWRALQRSRTSPCSACGSSSTRLSTGYPDRLKRTSASCGRSPPTHRLSMGSPDRDRGQWKAMSLHLLHGVEIQQKRGVGMMKPERGINDNCKIMQGYEKQWLR